MTFVSKIEAHPTNTQDGPAQLRQAAETLREDFEREFVDSIHEAEVMLSVAELLEEVAAWREEGLGLMPLGNLADAWLEVERKAKKIARLINGENA